MFLITAGLAGLCPHAPQPALHFIYNVRQPQEVLIDALQPPLGLDLFDFEAADAGGLLENHAAVFG